MRVGNNADKLLERGEKIRHIFGFLASSLRMGGKRDAMRPGCVERIGVGCERGFDNIEFAEHRRGKDVEPCAAFQQEIGDFLPPHVSCTAEGGFQIAAAPIPGCVDKGGFLSE